MSAGYGSALPAVAAIQDWVHQAVRASHDRLESDLRVALALQDPTRWRRLHVVARSEFTATVDDRVGWAASWVSISSQLIATDPCYAS